MKKIIPIILMVIMATAVFAQNPLTKGRSQINAGFGFSNWGIPVYIGLDYGIGKDVSIGGEISYKSYQEKYHQHEYRHSVISISANGNYHFNRVLNIPENWDFYAGLNVGFHVWNSPDDYDGSNTSGLGLGAQLGGRYYFTDAFGVNLEFGGGNALSGGKIGISVKL